MDRPSDSPLPVSASRRARKHADGRDELNLADFPISVLQRRQPVVDGGKKLDTVVYLSTRYDTQAHRRVPQKVTLTTSSQYGLPTPADENVVLALLYVAKKDTDFSDPKVFFSPWQLFRIMSWAPNSRSYHRLRAVLRRLKALTLIYENAWWDAAGGEYEQEFGTGIIAEYQLNRTTNGRPKADRIPPNWVQWAPRFFESLKSGNLKRLDLDQLFQLRLPTSQRMYRFLDKRFYQAPSLELDVRDFACGHLGITDTPNIAKIKQTLAPAIAELEKIGFIETANPKDRYLKIKTGVWRIKFRKPTAILPKAGGTDSINAANFSHAQELTAAGSEEGHIVGDFYRRWAANEKQKPSSRELDLARELIARHGLPKTQALIPITVALLRRHWPDAKAFGAIGHYIEDASAEYDRREREKLHAQLARQKQDQDETNRRRYERARQDFRTTWKPAWAKLSASDQEQIRQAVLSQHPFLLPMQDRFPEIIEDRCLQELANRSTFARENTDKNAETNIANGPQE